MDDTNKSVKQLIGGTEAAQILGLSRTRFYKMVGKNAFPSATFKVDGCSLLFRRDELLRIAGALAAAG
jgi:predicted DNA-binding transcriptional regulator AlpA